MMNPRSTSDYFRVTLHAALWSALIAPAGADPLPPDYAAAVASANYLPAKPAQSYEFDQPLEQALKFGQADGRYGQLKFDTRYRYEHVDDEGPLQNANANTLRLRAGYLTPEFFGLQGYAEYEGLASLQDDYNSTRNGKIDHSVVADPSRSELNQLWLSYKGIPDTVVTGGRLRIKLDDDRFIGNVGWRQMEQTFDGAIITNKSLPNLTATAGYIGTVQTVTSQTDDMTSPFVNLNYQVGDFGNMIGYAYWLDYDDKTKFARSSQTYGLRFTGAKTLNEIVGLVYTAEWSTQADYRNNPNDYQVDRYYLTGGASVLGVTLSGAIEQLGGKAPLSDSTGANSFQTPLGTNHAFQGWADKFLTTPGAGIRDVYATLSTQVVGTNLAFIYHSLQDDTGSVNYGDEYDFQVTRKFGRHYHLLAKYAYYNADQFSTDTQKVWVEGGINF